MSPEIEKWDSSEAPFTLENNKAVPWYIENIDSKVTPELIILIDSRAEN
jgi:hypothetical protein